MKTLTIIAKSGLILLILNAFKCDDHEHKSCENYVSKLDELRTKIENLVDASVCNENFECRSIAFGSKPCGGPWSYLVYSTSIDTLNLHDLVDVYNKIEQDYNGNCQQYSDCMFLSPTPQLECENNKCIAIY